jgi:hypothetical protein
MSKCLSSSCIRLLLPPHILCISILVCYLSSGNCHTGNEFFQRSMCCFVFQFPDKSLAKNVTEWLLTLSSSSTRFFCFSFSVTREVSPETVPKRLLHKVNVLLRISISRIVHYPKCCSVEAYYFFFVRILTQSFFQCVTSVQLIVLSEKSFSRKYICCFVFQFAEWILVQKVID